jgi:hypothetical protein
MKYSNPLALQQQEKEVTLFSVSSTNFSHSLVGLPMSGKMAAMDWKMISPGMKAMSFFL